MTRVWIALTNSTQELSHTEAAYRAFAQLHPDETVSVESKLVPNESTISALYYGPIIEQPVNELDTVHAAYTNYRYLTEVEFVESQKPDYYLALAVGLEKSCYNDDYLACAWAAASGEYQDPVYGRSQSFVLPARVAQRVMCDGLSCVAAMKACYPSEVAGDTDEELIAILSDGKITDAQLFAAAIEMALVGLKNRKLH